MNLSVQIHFGIVEICVSSVSSVNSYGNEMKAFSIPQNIEDEKDPSPAPSPKEAEKIVITTPAPQGLKDKILTAIRQFLI